MLKYKIILAGSKNVGKSSLIARFCDNTFSESMQDTIGVSFKRKKMTVSDKIDLDFNIWDFGGEEKYRTLFPQYLNGAAAALILYDTTRKETLDDVENWVKIIEENTDENMINILIGTKKDLVDQREIPMDEAKKHCTGWCDSILETSSKTGENVEDAFMRVAKTIIDVRLKTCKSCGEVFNKKLKFCNYCGD